MDDIQRMKALEARVLAGYTAWAKQDEVTPSRLWLSCWHEAKALMEERKIHSISEFDRQFPSDQPLYNWCQDLEIALGNAGQSDAAYLETRIAYCSEIAPMLDPEPDDPILENMRRAIADSHADLGRMDFAISLYHGWLEQDPCWGFGWIGLSDLYSFARSPVYDLRETERILLEGLSIKGVRDKNDLRDRLSHCRAEMRKAVGPRINNVEMAEPPVGKVGRNVPCPCGSGKKYKRCCGA